MINGKSRTTEEQGQNVLTENAAKKNPKYPTIELNQSARSVKRFGMCMLEKIPYWMSIVRSVVQMNILLPCTNCAMTIHKTLLR